ncbi:MAG TPA: HAD family hydrolase [Thermosynergistes sp.]|nr:HAD family hydrolase [Thermosynergistes sp.]
MCIAKGVLFDFDMTLVDSSWGITRAMNALARAVGLPRVSRRRVLRTIGLPLERAWFELWGRVESEWANIYRERFVNVESKHLKPLPGAIAALEELMAAGLKLGVVTNRRFASKVVSLTGLDRYFVAVIGLERVSNPKPHPEALEEGLRCLGLASGEAAFVGDSEIDMETARRANIRGIGVTTGAFDAEALMKAGAWRVINDLSELPYILELDSCGHVLKQDRG